MTMISIIVPVYNVEQYLRICVESIIAQTFSDWEIILVDDGSTDSSGYICDSFAALDKRIKCIHKPNGGVTDARKSGWEVSKGEWIAFVDGDDTLPNDSLEVLYKKTLQKDTDIVEGYHYYKPNLPIITSIDDYRHFLLEGVDSVSVAVWGKLFRRDILNSWCFDIPREIVRGEDWIMNIRIAFLSNKKPVLIPNKVYNYRDNAMGLSHVFRKNIDLEHAFFNSWKDSIPDQVSYSFSIVRIAVLMFVGVCVQDLRDVNVIGSSFANEIRNMIKGDGYNLKLHQKILLNSKSPLCRLFVWRGHCLKERLVNNTNYLFRTSS